MKKVILLGMAAVSLSVAACGDSNDDQGHVRLLNASPNSPTLHVAVDGEVSNQDVSFSGLSQYVPVESGSAQEISVNTSGTDVPVFTLATDVGRRTDYLLVAVGDISAVEPILLVTDRNPAPYNRARIRVVHAAPSASAVDVYVTGVDQTVFDTAPVLEGISYKSATQYVETESGAYNVFVTAAGTKNIVVEAQNVFFATRSVTTVAALDAPQGGSPFSLRFIADWLIIPKQDF